MGSCLPSCTVVPAPPRQLKVNTLLIDYEPTVWITWIVSCVYVCACVCVCVHVCVCMHVYVGSSIMISMGVFTYILVVHCVHYRITHAFLSYVV